MSDETTLLHCPLCDGEVEEPISKRWTNCLGDFSYSAYIRCDECNLVLTTRVFRETEEMAKEDVIAAWNTRAELGSGTCEPKWTLQGKTQTQEFWRCECGNCGEFFGVEDRSSFPFKMTIDEVDIPNFCPNCGTRIRKAVER